MTLQREDKVLAVGGGIAALGLAGAIWTGDTRFIDVAIAGISLGGIGKAIIPSEPAKPA